MREGGAERGRGLRRRPRPGRAASSGRSSRSPTGSSPLTSRPAVAAASRSNSSNRRGTASVPSGSNSIALSGRGPDEQEPRLLRRHDAADRVRGGPRPLRGRHLLAGDIQELVGEVERRLQLEHLAGDGVGAVPRPAGRREVLAVGLDRDAEQAPLRRPLEVPGELRRPAEGRDPAGEATTVRPGRRSRAGTRRATVSPSQSRAIVVPTLPQFGHTRLDRQPPGGPLDVRDPAVDVADDLGAVERGADERVHLPGRVDVAHPVVEVGVDAEAGEDVDERLGVVAGIGRVAVADLVRDVGERATHLALDGVGRQERLGVHRVHVVDAVPQRRLRRPGRAGPG